MRLCIHLHTFQTHRNNMYIEYFCCKTHFFLQKKNEKKVSVSELKEICKATFYISLFVFPLYISFSVMLKGSKLMQDIRHTSSWCYKKF